MSKIAMGASIALILTGCVTESMDPYDVKKNGGFGGFCTQWVMWEGTATESDSTAICADGNTPHLYYTQFFSTDGACSPMKESEIRGGLKGVRRVWGCRK